jgi:Glycoside-hydrolase family GH114
MVRNILALQMSLLTTVVACSSPAPPAGADVRLPPAGARFSYQLGGPYEPPGNVGIVERDRTAAPAAGRYSVCYVNAFQGQPGSLAWWQHNHPDLLLRNANDPVIDQQWGEPLLDITNPTRLMAVVGPWIDECARTGYQGVEADNLDSFTRSDGLLDSGKALDYSRLLVQRAHANGLAIGQKNAAELSPDARRVGFDFAVAEECQFHDECDEYTAVYGDALLEIEYTDQAGDAFARACAARGSRASVVLRDRELAPAGEASHVEQWCPQ